MTLKSWIEKTGPKVVAKKLKVDSSTVSNWKNGRSMPRAKKLKAIYKESKGKVSYREMIHHFVGR